MLRRLSLIVFALWFAAACRAMDHSASPSPSLGLTVPDELLSYQAFEGAPSYCATPASLLEEVAKGIHVKYSTSSASTRTDAAGVVFLRVTAPVPAAADATCRDHYDSEIWTEKERESTVDYRVKAFSWVRRVCNSQTYVAPALESGTLRMSDDLRALFDACRRR